MISDLTNTTSLRRRLLVRLVVPLLVLLIFGAIGTYMLALRIANNVFDGWLYDSVNSLALLVQNNEGHAHLNLSQSARTSFEWDISDKVYYAVQGDHSGIIAGRDDLPVFREAGTVFQHGYRYETVFMGEQTVFIVLNLPVQTFGENIRVIVGETTHKRDRQARELFITSLLPQALVIVLALTILWLGVRQALLPLEKLAQRLQKQDQYNIEPITDDSAPSEIQPLTHALNDLLLRLDTAMGAQRKFIEDAAHQLRTPLTALKIYIEEAQNAKDNVQLKMALEHLQAASDRAVRLSNQLLSLARAEPNVATAQGFQLIDLHQLALDVGAEWVPRAIAKGLELSFESSDVPIIMRADPMLLQEALNNLLDNAIKYHPGNGRIVLTVKSNPSPTIMVADDGAGISLEDRPNVFKRFYRGEQRLSTGSGLGLSIAQEIARNHGGTASLTEGLDERGVCVVLTLSNFLITSK